MIEWFKNLTDANKIAIVVPIALAVIGGLIGLFKWLFRKKDGPAPREKTIQQAGSGHKATTIDGDKNIVSEGDVSTGIDPNNILDRYEIALKQLGESEEKITNQQETIKQLEEQLAWPSLETNITLEQSKPVPSAQARELANVITEDDGLYAQALKAITEGDNEKANSFLDETQQFLDTVQQRKDEAQAKIYMARIQNASYAGKPQDALQYCDILTNLAGSDSLIINNVANVYYQNAKYKEAEPLMQRALKIDEASLGKDHPNVAIDLNNLAQLYKATNRLKEAEPLMQRALKIDEASLGKDHPRIAIDLNNLAQLYQATNRRKETEPLMRRVVEILENPGGEPLPNYGAALNNLAQLYQDTDRLKEAEPLMQRALAIDEASLGKDHPDVAIDLNNLAQLYQATNRLEEAEPLIERQLVIFLQFTRQTGHPHPHLEDSMTNYVALLMQMGHSKDQVDARLKRLAPEMFESTDKQVKEE